MIPAAIREAQADACLQAASTHKDLLLRVATHLAGNAEDGMELFQQNLLNCHDAIRKNPNGFTGDRYEFYLLAALKNLHRRTARENLRTVRVDFQLLRDNEQYVGRYEDGTVGAPEPRYEWLAQAHEHTVGQVGLAPGHDEFAALAEQLMLKASEDFSPADRVALRLHMDGQSCQDIAEMIGKKDQSWVWRRIKRMKELLRETFQRDWDALAE